MGGLKVHYQGIESLKGDALHSCVLSNYSKHFAAADRIGTGELLSPRQGPGPLQ